MWKTIVEGKPRTRLFLFLAIIGILLLAQPLVQLAPAVHATLVLVSLFFFVSFVL
jgi:hypothetical protein